MKAIYSIKQLHHSSNVGGATQHNGWHRATGDIADTVEISKSSRISRPARQVIAKWRQAAVLTARGIMWTTEMQKRPQINVFAQERGKAPG